MRARRVSPFQAPQFPHATSRKIARVFPSLHSWRRGPPAARRGVFDSRLRSPRRFRAL